MDESSDDFSKSSSSKSVEISGNNYIYMSKKVFLVI